MSVAPLTGENIKYGVYIAGCFVMASTEVRKTEEGQKETGYLFLAIGGRRGGMNVRYDLDDKELVDFIDGLENGDDVFAGVQVSGFRDNAYYKLVSLQYLRGES